MAINPLKSMFILIVSTGLGAAAVQADPIKITSPTLRTTIGDSRTTSAYVTLQNSGATSDRLLGVKTDISKMAGIHLMTQKDGVMSMAPVKGGLEIAPGAKVILAPMGLHIMLMGLAKPVVAGQKVPMTLIFEKAGEVPVTFIAAPLAEIRKTMKMAAPSE